MMTHRWGCEIGWWYSAGFVHRCVHTHSHLYDHIHGLVALLDSLQSNFSISILWTQSADRQHQCYMYISSGALASGTSSKGHTMLSYTTYVFLLFSLCIQVYTQMVLPMFNSLHSRSHKLPWRKVLVQDRARFFPDGKFLATPVSVSSVNGGPATAI